MHNYVHTSYSNLGLIAVSNQDLQVHTTIMTLKYSSQGQTATPIAQCNVPTCTCEISLN